MNTEDRGFLDNKENTESLKNKLFSSEKSFSEVENAFQSKREEENEPVKNEVERKRHKTTFEDKKMISSKKNSYMNAVDFQRLLYLIQMIP